MREQAQIASMFQNRRTPKLDFFQILKILHLNPIKNFDSPHIKTFQVKFLIDPTDGMISKLIDGMFDVLCYAFCDNMIKETPQYARKANKVHNYWTGMTF